MQFHKTPLSGAYLIEPELKTDNRGFFSRLFCVEEFKKQGLETEFVQANNSYSEKKGTLRGLHYQLSPMSEVKVVRCIRGSFYDVIVDLRQHSPTFKQSFGAILSEENRKMMYVPEGFAHGFLTLEDHSEVIYFISQFYSQEMERGIRWNDPAFNVAWPEEPQIISERDQSHKNFDPGYHLNSCITCVKNF